MIRDKVKLMGGTYFEDKNDSSNVLPVEGPREALTDTVPEKATTHVEIFRRDLNRWFVGKPGDEPKQFVMTREIYDDTAKGGKYTAVEVKEEDSTLGKKQKQISGQRGIKTTANAQIKILDRIIDNAVSAGVTPAELSTITDEKIKVMETIDTADQWIVTFQAQESDIYVTKKGLLVDIESARQSISPKIIAHDNAYMEVKLMREELGDNFADGPFMKETTTWGLGVVVAFGVGVWALRRWKYNKVATGNKSAMYAVFS
jgi:hypothetical protein